VLSRQEVAQDIAVREDRGKAVDQAISEKKKKEDAVHAEVVTNFNNPVSQSETNTAAATGASALPSVKKTGPVPASKAQTRAIPNSNIIKESKAKGYLAH